MGLNLAVSGCTTVGKQTVWHQPVPVDSVLQTEGPLMMVRVTLADSAMVSVDGSAPRLRPEGDILELWELSARSDTLIGTGGRRGSRIRHTYEIPPDAIATLEATAEEKLSAGLTVLTVAVVGALAVGMVLFVTTCNPGLACDD